MAWNLSTGLQKGMLGLTAPYGSFAELMANGTIYVYSDSRPVGGADAAETGSLLLKLTLNGDAFVSGVATNGLNLGQWSDAVIKRALDGVTGVTEIWRGAGILAGTAGWCRWHPNTVTTGASTTAVRLDGTIGTSGGDLTMVNGTSIVVGINSEVSDVGFSLGSA